MGEIFYGRCDTCNLRLKSRYHTLSRNIERHQFSHAENMEQSNTCEVLQSDRLTQYCGEACCTVGVYSQLRDRGIEFVFDESGSTLPCSKCGRQLDMRAPHIAYEVMDQTEIRTPWLHSVEPHDSEIVARLCLKCDPGIATDFEVNVAREKKEEILEFTAV